MPDVLGGKAPDPDDSEPATRTVNPVHYHTWWNDQGVRQESSCTCDTGHNHTTPREGR